MSNVRQLREKTQVTKPKVALSPKNPERVCWGCEKYCSVDDLRCGNGTIRTPHPVELFGEDWLKWELAHQIPEPRSVDDGRRVSTSSGVQIIENGDRVLE